MFKDIDIDNSEFSPVNSAKYKGFCLFYNALTRPCDPQYVYVDAEQKDSAFSQKRKNKGSMIKASEKQNAIPYKDPFKCTTLRR